MVDIFWGFQAVSVETDCCLGSEVKRDLGNMSTTANHIPFQAMKDRSEKRKREERQRNIWHRCETLLTAENDEDRRDAQVSAVLGYN